MRSPSRIVLLLLIASTLFSFLPTIAYAPTTPTIYVDPPMIDDMGLVPDSFFTIDIKIHAAVDLFAYEFKVGYDNSLLSPAGVEEGPFIKDQTTSPLGTYFTYILDDEYVYATCVTLGKYPGVDGAGILCNITFMVVDVGECDLPLFDTILLDSTGAGITHNTMDGFFANEPPIMIGTDMPMYSAGMNMTVSLNINNPLSSPINVCVAVWLERPTGPIIVILHAHAVTLPGKFRYSNPSFSQFTLPPIPPGIYKWHAALMSPGSHAILIQDIAEWEFV